MNHAERCPVCGGKGRLPEELLEEEVFINICHGCGGIGWIVVPDDCIYKKRNEETKTYEFSEEVKAFSKAPPEEKAKMLGIKPTKK